MTGVLLDTNVVSETVRPEPDGSVLSFLTADRQFWLSTIVLHELDYGVALLPVGWRRDKIAAALKSLAALHADRILPVGRAEAAEAARLRALARQSGRSLDLGDALIAATAAANGLALATRNTGDFWGLDLEVVNPWN
ncbi:MAG: PIN domain-containing protein [Acidimicrobiaceae bacterium]|nr:PIN domain-containing protein [Acidimicrobiaceae bacterium]MCY4281143.1 PIN domain-containing protein [Acidimicrobiaceae bacterium]MCY4294367.1 PIN domain-containing protein [Acidimicrobiaceae bacterium]